MSLHLPEGIASSSDNWIMKSTVGGAGGLSDIHKIFTLSSPFAAYAPMYTSRLDEMPAVSLRLPPLLLAGPWGGPKGGAPW